MLLTQMRKFRESFSKFIDIYYSIFPKETKKGSICDEKNFNYKKLFKISQTRVKSRIWEFSKNLTI